MRAALFLDRDGIVNVDHGYVGTRERFEWQDGIFALVRAGHEAGLLPVVVTNQSGIGRGYYGEAEFADLTGWMCEAFADRGTPIARVYHCPFHPDAVLPGYRDDPRGWRKPKPGMLLQAGRDLGLDLSGSVMVGDRWSDARAAWAAGLERALIVGEPAGEQPTGADRAIRVPSVAAAAEWLRAAFRPARPAAP